MEALGLPSLNSLTSSCSNFQVQNAFKISKRSLHYSSSELASLKLRPLHYLSSELSALKLGPPCRTPLLHRSVTRMVADGEDYDLKQMRDMAAARKRWEALVREEKVKVLMPREAGYAIQLSNKTLLDVRPSTERKKPVLSRSRGELYKRYRPYCCMPKGVRWFWVIGVFFVRRLETTMLAFNCNKKWLFVTNC